jgi:O-antigen ligase
MLFGLNISIIFFTTFFLNLSKKINPLKIKSFIQIVFLMFFFGALISVIDANSYDGFFRGLKVLPNYLYWVLICILLINIYKQIKLYSIARYLFFGIMISAIYFYLFPFLPKTPGFLNPITKNSFSFLAICFGAPSLMYILKNKGRIYFYIFSAILLFVLLSNGRRAGFIIVLATIFFSANLKSFKIKYFILTLFLLLMIKFFISLNVTNSFLMKSSPRIHQLIYSNSSDLIAEDRSLLVRRLMVEKALIIFEDNPLTGIGLNSFSSHNVNFRGDFEGSQFVINKSNTNSKSAHNSYVSLLSEGGLLLLIPFLIIIFFNIYKFVKYYNHRNQIENSFYWAFIGMCVHLYFISAILNVYAWFLLGIVSAICTNSKKLTLINK